MNRGGQGGFFSCISCCSSKEAKRRKDKKAPATEVRAQAPSQMSLERRESLASPELRRTFEESFRNDEERQNSAFQVIPEEKVTLSIEVVP